MCKFVQAAAVWNWWNFLEEQAARDGKAVLKLNLDETSVSICYPRVRGNIFCRKRRLPNTHKPCQNIKRSQLRSNFTCVCIICNRPDLQPLMPQVVICNNTQLSQKSAHEIRRALPANVSLVAARAHCALVPHIA